MEFVDDFGRLRLNWINESKLCARFKLTLLVQSNTSRYFIQILVLEATRSRAFIPEARFSSDIEKVKMKFCALKNHRQCQTYKLGRTTVLFLKEMSVGTFKVISEAGNCAPSGGCQLLGTLYDLEEVSILGLISRYT